MYDPAHDEQRLNAGMLAAHRLGAACPADSVDEEALAAFLESDPADFSPAPWDAPDAAEVVLDHVQALLAGRRSAEARAR